MAKFSKRTPLKNGDRVSVVARASRCIEYEKAMVNGNGRHRRALAPLELVQLTAASEGITWCRGWTGREVDALRTAAALS